MIKKQIRLLKKQGLKTFLKEKKRKFNYYLKVKKHFPNDLEKWTSLKDKYKGQRVFLIGNGPSLNKTPLYLLKNEKLMCFNRFHLMLEKVNWKPDFYTIVDNLVLDDLLNEFEKVQNNADYVFIPSVHIQGDVFVNRVAHTEKINWFKHKLLGSGFSTDLPSVYSGGTVIFEGFQILKHLGFAEIVMIGVDMSYQIHKTAKSIKDKSNNIESLSDDDPNHFDPRYFGKGKKYHQPEDYVIKNILNNLKKLSQLTDSLNLKIVNAGFDSQVEYFPKENFYHKLNLSQIEIQQLFEETIQVNTVYGSLDMLKKRASELSGNVKHILEKDKNYIVNLEIGVDLIKKNVFTHVCFGPFQDTLYFVCRKNMK